MIKWKETECFVLSVSVRIRALNGVKFVRSINKEIRQVSFVYDCGAVIAMNCVLVIYGMSEGAAAKRAGRGFTSDSWCLQRRGRSVWHVRHRTYQEVKADILL